MTAAQAKADLRARVKALVAHPVFDAVIVVLILASVIMIIIEQAVTDPGLIRTLDRLDLGVIFIFIVELSLRFWAEQDKKRFFAHYWPDILAVIPVFRAVRLIRLFRLFRLFRLYRIGVVLTRRLARYSEFLREGSAEFIILGVLIVIVVLFSAFAMTWIEVGDEFYRAADRSVWWALFSLVASEPITEFPVSTGGRILTMGLMLAGMTVFAMFTGIIAAFMVDRIKNRTEAGEMDLRNLENHILVCGWSHSAPMVIEELQAYERGRNSTIVILAEMDAPPELSRFQQGEVLFVNEDFIKVDALKKVRADKAAAALIVATSRGGRAAHDVDARTVLAALTIEKLAPGIYTCAEVLNPETEVHLKMAGVETVLLPHRTNSLLLASTLVNRGILSVISEILTATYGNRFFRLPVPESWVGKPFIEGMQTLKRDHDAVLLSVEQDGADGSTVNPPADRPFARGDFLIYIACNPIGELR